MGGEKQRSSNLRLQTESILTTQNPGNKAECRVPTSLKISFYKAEGQKQCVIHPYSHSSFLLDRSPALSPRHCHPPPLPLLFLYFTKYLLYEFYFYVSNINHILRENRFSLKLAILPVKGLYVYVSVICLFLFCSDFCCVVLCCCCFGDRVLL